MRCHYSIFIFSAMDTSSIILVLSCLGIAQALFLCFYLFGLKKGNRKAHLFLGLIILGLTIRIGKSILNQYLDLTPWQRNLGIAGILMVGPSLLLYSRVLLRNSYQTTYSVYLHFLPYLLFSLGCMLIPNQANTISLVVYYLVFLHLLIYILWTITDLSISKNSVQKTVFNWLRNVIIGVAVIWVFYMGNVLRLIPFYIGGAICYTFLVYIFSFLFLKKHTFHLEKYKGQQIDNSVSNELMQNISSLFKEEAIYLNPKITLTEVAKKLEVNSKTLSRVINEQTGKNFSEFVNSYRIEKAKSLLTSVTTKNEKIASIAYDSGFNNVTSFNIAFKAMTQLTPSEYRKQFS